MRNSRIVKRATNQKIMSYEDKSMSGAYSAKLLQFGQAVQSGILTTSSVTSLSTTAFSNPVSLSAGNSGASTLSNQLLLKSKMSQNVHAINTRHNASGVTDNAVDFFVWQYGTDTTTTIGSKPALTISQTGVGINNLYPSAALDLSGSARISSTISAAAASCSGTVSSTAVSCLYATISTLNLSSAFMSTLSANSLSATYLTISNSLTSANLFAATLSVGTLLNFSSSPVCFRLYSSTTIAYSSGSSIAAQGATKDFDTSGGVSTTTGLFTAPIAGYYQFGWKARMPDGSNNYVSLQFSLNGTLDETDMWLPTDVSNRHCGAASTLRFLRVGDTMGVYMMYGSNSLTSYEYHGFLLR